MATWIAVVLAVVVIALWKSASEKDADYRKECREHMEACQEIGRLNDEISMIRRRHNDWS